MEMVVFVEGKKLDVINEKLRDGWTVKECRPVTNYTMAMGTGSTSIYAYFVLKKD